MAGQAAHFLMAPTPTPTPTRGGDGSEPSAPPPLPVKGAVHGAETQPLSLRVPLPGWGHVALSEEAGFPPEGSLSTPAPEIRSGPPTGPLAGCPHSVGMHLEVPRVPRAGTPGAHTMRYSEPAVVQDLAGVAFTLC